MNFKIKKSYYRLFSMLLSVIMIVLSVPVSAVAQDEVESVTNVDSTSKQVYNASTFQKSPEVLAADAEAMRREQLIQNGIDPDQPLSNNSTAQFVQGGEELQPLVSYDQVLSGGEGVYAIKHLRGNYFIKTEHPEWLAGYHMQQQYTSSSTIMNNFSTGYLFKLTQHPQTGSYIIRLMYNNALSFAITPKVDGSGYEVLTKDIQLDDALVPVSDTYVISASSGENGSGFKIRKYGTTNCIAVNGSQTNLTATTEIGDSIRWTFTQYTGAERNSAVMLYSSTPTVGQTTTLIPVIYSTRPRYNMPHLDMSQIPSSSYSISGPNEYGRFSLTPHDGPDWTFHIYVKNASLTSSTLVYASAQEFKIKLPIDEGVYFINNVKYPNKYAQINNVDNMYAPNTIIELHQFYGYDYQQWNVQHVLDGYYKIISKYSNLELTAPTGYGNDVVTQASPSSANTHLWKFIKQSDGTYKISPKSNSNCFMAAGDVYSYADQDLEIRSVQSDGGDEWELTEIQYIANVFNYYDMGYPIRYGESTSVASSKINSYIDMVGRQYLRLFGLELTPFNATYYQSPLDLCKGTVTSNNIDNLCSHGGVVHSERSNVISDFNSSHVGDSKTTYVLWSCHKITSTATSGVVNYNRSCSSGTGIFLISINTTDRDQKSQAVLMHELNHQYGARDHYHELADPNDYKSCKFKDICSECGVNKRPASCIMNTTSININSDSVICQPCIEEILAHLSDHHQ